MQILTDGSDLKILIAEDRIEDAELMVRELEKAGYSIRWKCVDQEDEFQFALSDMEPDLVLSDYSMPEFSGSQVLTILNNWRPFIPVIIVTGSLDDETAASTILAGASEYVIKERLKRLPAAVKIVMDKRKLERENEEQREKLLILSNAIEHSSASIVITNIQADILYVNPGFTAVTGYSSEEARGQNPRILQSGILTADFYNNMWSTLTRGETWRGNFNNKKKSGELFWESAVISPVIDSEACTIGYVAVKEDITEQVTMHEKMRKELREKNLLLQEVYHRVYNNLQVMISMLNMAKSKSSLDETRDILQCLHDRYYALAAVQDTIYNQRSYSSVDVNSVVLHIFVNLIQNAHESTKNIKLNRHIDVKEIPLNLAMPLSLILNELLLNSIQHAFPEDREGNIWVQLKEKRGDYSLTVRDDGQGLSEALDLSKLESGGFALVYLLGVEQLKGDLKLSNKNGLNIVLRFRGESL